MSLVNAETGEVVDIADHEEATHLVAEASAAIAHMNVWTGKAIEAVTEAHTRRAWIALGYGSWDEMVEAQRWVWKPLTSGERGAVAEVMRQKGMSFRAIGAVLASSDRSIRRDLAGAANAAPDRIVGADGKSYAATQPERPEPEPEPVEWDGPVVDVTVEPDEPTCPDCGNTYAVYHDPDGTSGYTCVACDTADEEEIIPDATPAQQNEEVAEPLGSGRSSTATSSTSEGAASPSQAHTPEPHHAATDSPAAPSPSDPAHSYAKAWLRTVDLKGLTEFDAERLAEVSAQLPHLEIDQQVRDLSDFVSRFTAAYLKARRPGLSVIAGGQP